MLLLPRNRGADEEANIILHSSTSEKGSAPFITMASRILRRGILREDVWKGCRCHKSYCCSKDVVQAEEHEPGATPTIVCLLPDPVAP